MAPNSSFFTEWCKSSILRILILIISLICLPIASRAQIYQLQSQSNGLERAYYGHGVSAADYDNDGDIDIYLVTRIPTNPFKVGTENLLYRNNGDGTFLNVAKDAGVAGIMDTTTIVQNKLITNYGASWGDFDNDGDVDLYLTNMGQDEFYENLGDGHFRDISLSSGLARKIRDSTSAAWFDVDNDGDLDLYISAYSVHGTEGSSANILYRNDHGYFTDITETARVGDTGFTYSTMVFDANSDGWLDLYCVNDFGANRFYLNEGNGTFREATREYGLENEGHGMGVTLGDFDGNGLLDIYLTNIADDLNSEWSPLFKQIRPGTFQDVTTVTGTGITNWAWGCEFLDFDLDGDLDLYVVNGFSGNRYHNRLYRNQGDGTFDDISLDSGAASEIEARGLVVADFDDNGTQDLFVANWQTKAQLFFNSMYNGNYLKVNLIGVESNRDARGAIVTVIANGRSYYRPNDGIEFLGQSKTPIHFGLGQASIIQKIYVKWPGPSGSLQEFQNINTNQTITITEGENVITHVANNPVAVPHDFRILGNSPNPVRDVTTLYFQTSTENRIKIEIYNLLGQRIATLTDQSFAPGTHKVQWHTNSQPSTPAGIYLARIQSGSLVDQHKIVVIK